MKKYNLLFTLVLAVLMWGCLDVIELEQPERPALGMVIQGRLTAGDPSLVEVNVSELFVYSTNLPNPIGGATVVLHNDLGQSVHLVTSFDGWYRKQLPRQSPDFVVSRNQTYRLEVSLPNGKRFVSAWEPIAETPQMSNLDMRIVQRDVLEPTGTIVQEPYVSFEVNTPLKVNAVAQRSRLMWELDQTYKITEDQTHPDYISLPPKVCYITNRLNQDDVLVLDGRETGADALSGYPLMETDLNSRFAEGFYVTVYQHALSDAAYNYLYQVSQLLASRGTIFDPPPGTVSTNFSSVATTDPVFGFFYATAPDTLRLQVRPEQVGNPRRNCPLPPPMAAPPPVTVCDNCLSVGGSTTTKPSFWID